MSEKTESASNGSKVQGLKEVVVYATEKDYTRKSLSARTGWQPTSRQSQEGLTKGLIPTTYCLHL